MVGREADGFVVVHSEYREVVRHRHAARGRGLQRLPGPEVVRGEERAGPRQGREAAGEGVVWAAGQVFAPEPGLRDARLEAPAALAAPFSLLPWTEPREVPEVSFDEVVRRGAALGGVVA